MSKKMKVYATIKAPTHYWVDRLHRLIADMPPNKQTVAALRGKESESSIASIY